MARRNGGREDESVVALEFELELSAEGCGKFDLSCSCTSPRDLEADISEEEILVFDTGRSGMTWSHCGKATVLGEESDEPPSLLCLVEFFTK